MDSKHHNNQKTKELEDSNHEHLWFLGVLSWASAQQNLIGGHCK